MFRCASCSSLLKQHGTVVALACSARFIPLSHLRFHIARSARKPRRDIHGGLSARAFISLQIATVTLTSRYRIYTVLITQRHLCRSIRTYTKTRDATVPLSVSLPLSHPSNPMCRPPRCRSPLPPPRSSRPILHQLPFRRRGNVSPPMHLQPILTA